MLHRMSPMRYFTLFASPAKYRLSFRSLFDLQNFFIQGQDPASTESGPDERVEQMWLQGQHEIHTWRRTKKGLTFGLGLR